jgi:uncharacterized membrane protein
MALIASPWLFWPLVVLALALFGFLWPLLADRWRWAFWLRLLLVAATLFAVFQPPEPAFETHLPAPAFLLLDLSVSVSDQARNELIAQAINWQAAGTYRRVVVFGAAQDSQEIPAEWGRYLDLSTTLEVVSGHSGPSGTVLLATDAQSQSVGQVAAQLNALKEAGYSISILPIAPESLPNDLYIASLNTPDRAWEQTPVFLIASVIAPAEGLSSMQLTVNGTVVETRPESLREGLNTISFAVQSGGSGNFSATLAAAWEGDPRLINNQAFATSVVIPAPDVLIVSDSPDDVSPLADALRASGMGVEVLPPGDVPVSTAGLNRYQVIFLDNVLAHTLSLEQQLALEHFVADQGRGLVVLGGRSSYALGGYEGTILETMLPVSLEPPPRTERPPITFVMVLDRSGSMQGERGLPIRPIDLAKEAAIRAVETLHPDDYLGVLTYSGEALWDVGIRQLGTGLTARQATDAISQISPQGGTNMYIALGTALDGIFQNRATEAVHILLLTDGISFDGSLDEFNSLALLARTQEITISTIALGSDTDPLTLETIAETADGRFFAVTNPAELPLILVAESKAARAENIQSGATNLLLNIEAHPVMLGVAPANLPAISVYNAVTSKRDQGSEDILLSANFEDPLLAAWGYGLGRVIAWTSDNGTEWARGWPTQSAFWGQVARYALPDPSISNTQVNITPDGEGLLVEMMAFNDEGVPLNFAAPEFSYIDLSGAVRSYALIQTAPGEYRLRIDLPEPGAYRGLIAFLGAQGYQEIAAPFAVDLSADLFPPDEEAIRANLARWQAAGDAAMIGIEDLGVEPVEEIVESNLNWRSPLLTGMLAYWLIEIAARRRWLPWT